eukprot:PRCOL_00006546-RA
MCAAASAFALYATWRGIPVCMEYMQRKGNCGKDINKRGTPGGAVPVPESLGLVCGMVWLAATIALQQALPEGLDGVGDASWQVEYNAALLCVCFMLLLGFVDDMLDIPWRYKLALPFVGAMPLLGAYKGHTAVVIPHVLRPAAGAAMRWVGLGGAQAGGALPELLELGPLYLVYIAALAVFCTNSINIHAGVNGLEAGQSLVMSAAVLVLNLSHLAWLDPAVDGARYEAHLLSVFLMGPFYAATAALLLFNWYPSTVFVGDTYTYFAGMTFAVAGVLGHFSETLLVFFAPQVVNFLYSLPQLMKLPGFPCPRHRLPSFDVKTGVLRPTDVNSKLWSPTGSAHMNCNLVNLALRWGGSCGENALCIRLIVAQVLAAVGAFGLRAALSSTGYWKS